MADIQEGAPTWLLAAEHLRRASRITSFLFLVTLFSGLAAMSYLRWSVPFGVALTWINVMAVLLWILILLTRELRLLASAETEERGPFTVIVDQRNAHEDDLHSQLKALPRIAFEDACSQSRFTEEGTDCGICLETFVDSDEVHLLLPCNHAFHVQCIRRWVIFTMSCPNCRQRVELQSQTSQRGEHSAASSEAT
ncbi:hypothetical protein KP509_24G002200 [Ceratopteris richardii]|uniref:RING-type domain-containing protein n=1 Tax=Ceratopteris richardii TaxID=49495 RepID=A0A8T2RSU5_CERRI|nr:hypothetical protein KP509_24G002200 [Ceratopteris richardii]